MWDILKGRFYSMDFKINEFEGPLDLLLHLIKESKMNIMDIEIFKW